MEEIFDFSPGRKGRKRKFLKPFLWLHKNVGHRYGIKAFRMKKRSGCFFCMLSPEGERRARTVGHLTGSGQPALNTGKEETETVHLFIAKEEPYEPF